MKSQVGQKYVKTAIKMADTCGEIIRHYFRHPVKVDKKIDKTPVTVVDKKAEKAIREIIEKNFPGHGIIGEEYGNVNEDSECVWVIDPIDGTKSFVAGVPLFGTLIALIRNGEPVLGIIDQPILNERWIGVKGEPTRLNGEIVKTRDCKKLEDASLFASSPDMFQGANKHAFDKLADEVAYVRFGLDCYAYAMLANGHADIVCEADMKFHDYAALVPIIKGAGGNITDWLGEELTAESDGTVLAVGDRALHKETISKLIREGETSNLPIWGELWDFFAFPFRF